MSDTGKQPPALFLGTEHSTDEPVYLPIKALNKHVSVFGQSGSGKTVACKIIIEEAISKANIPAIIIDPQGDISCLAMVEDYEKLKPYGITEEFYNQYKDKIEVVIFTPASEKGIPLSINPLIMPPQELDREEKILAIDGMATTMANVLGYKLNSEKGGAVKAYLVSLFEQCLEKDILIADFEMLIDLIKTEEAYLSNSIRSLLSAKEKESLIKRIKSVTVGAPSLVFNLGPKLSVQTLIRPTDPKKVRIAIIFLNTLSNLRLRELYITTLAQSLYTYIRSNPSAEPQLIFYIDELAGPPQLIPPHPRNPPTKQWLQLLFKQGRKFGLSMLVATQNISDVDYKAFGQVSTFLFGRFVTPQDLRIVDKMLQSHPEARFIVDQLPKFRSGEFYVLSPDVFKTPVHILTRRLYSIHKTLSDEDIARMYELPPPTLCKQIGDYDHDIDSVDFDDIEKELNLEDLEKELSTIRKLTKTPSLLDDQIDIEPETTDQETEVTDLIEEAKTHIVEESVEKPEIIESIDLSHIVKSMGEQYLKYEPVDFKDLLQKFFGGEKIKYLGTESLELAYLPFLYLDFQIQAKRRIKVNYANSEKLEDVVLELPIKRIFPLVDRVEFKDGEKIWNESSIPIQPEEVFEELISILPMKNLGSLFAPSSSNIKQLNVQREPESILESFHDVLLIDQTFYTDAWNKAINEGLVKIEEKHKAEIKIWLDELEKERDQIWTIIDDKRRKIKQFKAKIEEAKAIYITLKPLMEDKFKYKSTGEVGNYNKAVETIKFGPEVVQNFVKEVENGVARIKEIDKIYKSSPKVKMLEESKHIINKKDFITPKASEIKDIYAALVYIPISLAEISIVDSQGNQIQVNGIAESVLGTEVHLLCDMCLNKHSAKMLFVSTPDICSVCGKVLCRDHTIVESTTKSILCSEHAVVCSYCKNVVSSNKATKCDFCDDYVCEDHVVKCSNCKKVICKKHSKEIEKKSMFKEEKIYKCPDHVKRK